MNAQTASLFTGAKGCAKKLEKNDCQGKHFAVKRSTLEGCRRTVTADWSDFDYKDSSQRKGNSTVIIK